jgi:uncharacterized protein (TIGR00369 family)
MVPYFELLRLVDASSADGRSACTMEVGDWLVGAGALGIQAAVTGFADCVLSYAATAPQPGDLNVTLGLQVDFWRAPPSIGSRLTGTAEVQSQQGAVALVLGRILEGDDVLATASLRAMTAPSPASGRLPSPSPSPSHGTRSTPTGPSAARPDADLAPANARSAGSGTAHQPPLTGDRDLAKVLALDLATMSGAEVVAVGEGTLRLRLVMPPTFERTVGIVHGGAVAAIGQLASAAAMQAALPVGVHPRRLSVTIDFLRPTLVGPPVEAVATVVHRSRRVIVMDVDLFTADGRRTARLTERAMIEEVGDATVGHAHEPRWPTGQVR